MAVERARAGSAVPDRTMPGGHAGFLQSVPVLPARDYQMAIAPAIRRDARADVHDRQPLPSRGTPTYLENPDAAFHRPGRGDFRRGYFRRTTEPIRGESP